MQEERRKMEDEFSELDLPHPEMSELAPYYFRCPDCRSMIVDVVKEKEGGRQFLCHHCGKQLSYDELVDSVYPNCICEFCGEPLVMPEEMAVFAETCYCSKCNYDLSKND